MGILLNPLGKFVSYNYVWTLSALNVNEVNSTGLPGAGNIPIIRSSGLPDKTITTAAEDAAGIKVEYFIDNISIDSLISNNPGTSTSVATKITFQVTEPYSIGLFLQTLHLASKSAGFENYIEAPFSLSCEFVGYDDSGKVTSQVERKTFVVKLVNLTFKVDASGSVYDIECIPWNHSAFTDEVQNVRTSVKISGITVEEILKTGEKSLLRAINYPQEEAMGRKVILQNDVYDINFVTNSTGPSSGSLYNTGTVNGSSFATSNISKDFDSYGTSGLASLSQVYNPSTMIMMPTSINDITRTFQYSQNTKIEKIIEDVLLTSEWGQGLISRNPNSKGMIPWFKIFSRVNILSPDNGQGRPALNYIYDIYEQEVHVSQIAPNTSEQNYVELAGDCVKAYFYSYTGLNTDVLDLEFTIDNSFFKTLADPSMASVASTGSGPRTITKEIASIASNAQVSRLIETNGATPVNKAVYTTADATAPTGAAIDDEKRRVAELFNRAILNSDVDNVTLDLKIWGDPYYLPDADAGNYQPGTPYRNITSNNSVNFRTSEVDILLNFSSALDYKGNGLIIDSANAFTGIYKVITLNSNFSNGQFTNSLHLLKRPNQDNATRSYVQSIVEQLVSGGGYTVPVPAGSAASTDLLFSEVEKLSQVVSKLGFLNIIPTNLLGGLSNIPGQLGQIFGVVNQATQLINNVQNLRTNLLQAFQPLNIKALTEIPVGSEGMPVALAQLTGLSQSQIAQQISSGAIDISQLEQQLGRSLTGQSPTQVAALLSQNAANVPSTVFPTGGPGTFKIPTIKQFTDSRR